MVHGYTYCSSEVSSGNARVIMTKGIGGSEVRNVSSKRIIGIIVSDLLL